MRCFQLPNGGDVERSVTPTRLRESGTKAASYLEEAILESSFKGARFPTWNTEAVPSASFPTEYTIYSLPNQMTDGADLLPCEYFTTMVACRA